MAAAMDEKKTGTALEMCPTSPKVSALGAEDDAVPPPSTSNKMRKDGSGVRFESLTSEEDTGPLDPATDNQMSAIAQARQRQRQKALQEVGFHKPVVLNEERKYAADVEKLLNNPAVQTVLTVTLILSLFFADIWTIANPPDSADAIINSILFIVVLLFTVEILGNYYARPQYNLKSGVLWMDVLGTVSVLIDISWIVQLETGGQNATAVRAARIAKLGTKTSRLARLVKIFKFLVSSLGVEDGDSTATIVTRRLSRLVSQGVAFLTLFVVIVNPLFNVTLTDFSYQSMGKTMDLFVDDLSSSTPVYNFTAVQMDDLVSNYKSFYSKVKDRNTDNLVGDPVRLRIKDSTQSRCPTYNSRVKWLPNSGECEWKWNIDHVVRQSNKFTYKTGAVEVQYDYTRIAREDSIKSMCLVVFVILLLVGFTTAFTNSAEALVVRPIHRILARIKESAKSILLSITELVGDEDNTEGDEDKVMTDDELNNAVSETDVLEMIINKLTRVMKNSMRTKLAMEGQEVDEDVSQWLSSQYSEVYTSAQVQQKLYLPSSRASMGLDDLPCSMDSILSFSFNTLDYSHDELVPCVKFMYSHFKLLQGLKIDEGRLISFIEAVRARYNTEPAYHNWWHGVDVCHTVFRFITATSAHSFLSQLEVFATITAALGHDVGHLGVNNAFLVKTKSKLALQYNDSSPLENMHCASLYEVLRMPPCNIMVSFSDDDWHSARAQILKCILNTDMVLHAKNLAGLQTFVEVSGSAFSDFIVQVNERGVKDAPPLPECLKQPETRLMIQETFLHCADLSNPVHALETYKQWVVRVTDEFFAQGDREKEMGMPPSPMCDRDSTNIASMQVNFIDFVIAPLYTTMFNLFLTSLLELAHNLKENHAYYVDLRVSELPSKEDPEAVKMLARKTAMANKLNFLFPAEEPNSARGPDAL